MRYEMNEQLISQIEDLKAESDAVILAHNYQPGEIQDLADFTGDSLGLSIQASKTAGETSGRVRSPGGDGMRCNGRSRAGHRRAYRLPSRPGHGDRRSDERPSESEPSVQPVARATERHLPGQDTRSRIEDFHKGG